MKKLTIKHAIKNQFTHQDCIKYFKPEWTSDECNRYLWEETCFPFSTELVIHHLNSHFLNMIVLVEKAWTVFHAGMLNSNKGSEANSALNDLYYSKEDIEVTYADTKGQSKQCANSHPYDWLFDNREVKYIELRSVRNKAHDKVLYNKQYMTRNQALRLIEEQKTNNIRKARVEKFPDDAIFYIQNGYVGNSALWWALGGSGYTTDFEKAQAYSKTETLERFTTGRDEDVPWESQQVLNALRQHVDANFLK